MLKIYRWPQRYITFSVPIVLLIGFLIGSMFDTTILQPTLLIATIVMIYATMVGFNLKELTSLKGTKVLVFSILINFLIIPIIAYLLGRLLLADYPMMFAGLALSALLPTSGMTISWTVLQRGNVGAAVKLTIFGLIIGSVLAPWYLLLMVGQYVDIDIWATMRTILMVVFVPLILGQITYKLIMMKSTVENFNKNIKPNFGPLSIWAMLYVIFVSISTKADMIVNNLSIIWTALIVLIIFYLLNFIVSTLFAVKLFNREDGIALVNGTVLRNLSIAIGLAATSFGAEAALIVTLAFVVQQQGIVNYAKIAMPRWFQLKS